MSRTAEASSRGVAHLRLHLCDVAKSWHRPRVRGPMSPRCDRPLGAGASLPRPRSRVRDCGDGLPGHGAAGLCSFKKTSEQLLHFLKHRSRINNNESGYCVKT